MAADADHNELRAELSSLRERLAEHEETLQAIRTGSVDALVVEGPNGPQVYSLEGVDAQSNHFRGEILAQVSEAVVAVDPHRRITYLNPAAERQYGVETEDMLGREMDDLFHETGLDADVREARERSLRDRGEWRGRSRHLLRDGRQVPVESNLTVIRGGASAGGLILVVRDISERERTENELRAREQALRESDRRKDEFLATLAHELRNPLAPVRNAVQILQLKGPPMPELRWARGVIDRQVEQLTRLIDDLMDVSRINQGRVELRREWVELSRVVQRAIETSRPLIEKSGLELAVQVPPDAVIVDADLTRLAQVITNLLNNAAKYTDRGGRVELRAERQGRDVVITVRDTGIGIPAARQPELFGMFTQIESGLARSQGGLGIGLFLVKRLVEMHGGTIGVHSDGLGAGSEFVARLPIVVEQGAPGARRENRDADVPSSNLRIAIVDDNVDVVSTLAMLLTLMGNTTRTAHDGEEAVQVAREFKPEVMLLDIGLPHLNGYEAARAIRALPEGHGMVLIAMTGWGHEEDRRRSEESGFDHHLVKPVDPRTLMTLLAGLELPRGTPSR